jgi:hypothetical protein
VKILGWVDKKMKMIKIKSGPRQLAKRSKLLLEEIKTLLKILWLE